MSEDERKMSPMRVTLKTGVMGRYNHFYQLMLQSWHQKTAQSLVNTLSFS